MRVMVRLFARLRDLAGAGELDWHASEGSTAGDLWRALTSRYPDLAPYGSSVSCAVNGDYARMSAPITEGDEVAFLPPVSGGACRRPGAGSGDRTC